MIRFATKHFRYRRLGVVAVMTVAVLLTILSFAALAVDVGYICALTAEQQNNADSSALAGASGLQDDDWYAARRRALNMLALNQPPQGYHSLDDQVIEFGWFDSVNNAFHVLDDPERAFAVRVRAARNGAPLFFANLIGISSTDVSRYAVAAASRPCTGIWGLEGINAGSINTDSYISTDGPYSLLTARDNGDLCSGRDIKVHGSFEVNGDVQAGWGYEVTIAGGSGVLTGMTTSHQGGLPPVAADLDGAEFNNDNDTIPLTDGGKTAYQKGPWKIDLQGGDNLSLDAGEYYFDSLKLSGGATVTTNGKTTFYLAGPIDATGGSIVNASENPHDLTIISMDSTVKIGGGAVLYGSIMAPNATVELKGEAFYGALVGRFVELKGDFTVHVDESLPLAQPFFDPPPPSLVK